MLNDRSIRIYVLATSAWAGAHRNVGVTLQRTRADDRGEGVVSAAIVVLIMAAIGALMWVGFRTMWTNIEADTNQRISEVGN
jgi:TRAP-type C4-dicarboxylate transport system permease small subunit